MIKFVSNRIKMCNCEIKEWNNNQFDYTEDYTLLCYRGFKSQYKDNNLIIKTGNNIQEFILCKYCRHFRCKDHFGPNKTQRIAIRKCCFECLAAEEVKRNSQKLKYSISQKNFTNENGQIVKADELTAFLDGS